MSLTQRDFTPTTRRPDGIAWERLGYAVLATVIVAGGLLFLSWLLLATDAFPRVAPRNPFGLTLREVAPGTTGIAGLILAIQAQFYGALTAAVYAMKADNSAITSLATVGFLYGIFHAAGPGHGKGIITGYLVAGKRSLGRGLTMSFAAAMLQASVAVTLVGILMIVFKAGAASIDSAARVIEIVSFAAIAAFGMLLVWWKAGRLVAFLAVVRDPSCRSAVDQEDLPPPAVLERIKDWREMMTVVVAAGIRPCSGAILLLVFAISQGLFAAGVVGAFAMAIGTAITTSTLAVLAVFAKSILVRLTAGRGLLGGIIVAGFEVLAAALVLVLGLMLLTGIWTGGLPSMLD
jgi:nickel/cobalt transporter (NicO) family protein